MSGSQSHVLTVIARVLTLSGAAITGWSDRHNTETPTIISNNTNLQTEMTSRIEGRPRSYQVDAEQRQEAFTLDISGMGRILPLLVALPVMAAASYYLGTVKVLH